MTSKVKLKEAYEVESIHGAFYTGGNVELHSNIIYCQTDTHINLLNIEDGSVKKICENNEDIENDDNIQTFTTDGYKIITAHKSGLLKQWNIEDGKVEKIWKSIHKGPIAKLQLNGDSLASGGTDGIIRIWDIPHHACIGSFKGCQGVVSLVEWHEQVIYGSGDDGAILSFSRQTFKYEGHYSKVTAIQFTEKNFISSGRDKVIILWEINKNTPIKVIPTYESIESITLLNHKFRVPGFKSEPDGIYVASGGDSGLIKIWNCLKATKIYEQTESLINKSEDGGLAITKLITHEDNENNNNKALILISADQNILIYHLKSFVCTKQFIGFSDEILDIEYLGEDEDFLAVATNSPDIKLYDAIMNCKLLKGHTDIVLALACSKSNPNLLLSSSKDNTIRLWVKEDKSVKCVALGQRHTASVSTITFPNQTTKFAISGSQDTCLKLWEIPLAFTDEKILSLNSHKTVIAHEKDINYVSVSPNDRIIATASQDKTAKLWTADELQLIGTLKGHKRGVWCIRFSPIDQVLITSSADCTIKLWSVENLNCLKTIESHDSSVLKCHFLSHGAQILSAGADGLIKLFNLKTSECTATFDQHDGRIWALCINKNESNIISGGSDSKLIKWRDVTDERIAAREKELKELTLEEQKLNNFIQNDQYLDALKLSLKLQRPLQTLKIIQAILKRKKELGGDLSETLMELNDEYKEALFNMCLTWNTNSKNCQAAQLVLNLLLRQIQKDSFKPTSLSTTIETALPYTERHFKRLTNLKQDLYFLNYTINCMQPHAK